MNTNKIQKRRTHSKTHKKTQKRKLNNRAQPSKLNTVIYKRKSNIKVQSNISKKSNKKNLQKKSHKKSHKTDNKTVKKSQLLLAKNIDKLRQKLLKIRKQNQPHFGNTYVQNMSNNDFNGIDIESSNPRKTGIIMFYAPWCPHCHSMVPILNEVADNIYENSNTNDIIVGSVDCTSNSNQDLNDTMNIMGYPTLKLYVDGKYVSDYSGPRDANALLLTIQKLKN